jgi:hypothetical protein
MSKGRIGQSGPVIDVTPAEAVEGDSQLEAEIGLGAPVPSEGQTFASAPESMSRAPLGDALSRETEVDRVVRLRERYPIPPGAPVPAGLRTPQERERFRQLPDAPPPQLMIAGPAAPFAAPAAPLPRDLDELLRAAVIAAVNQEDDETRDILIAIQGDRKKKRVSADVGPAEGMARRHG